MLKKVLDKYFEKTKGFYPFFKYCPRKYHVYYINKRASRTLDYEYNYLNPRSFNEKVRWLIYNEKLKIKSLLTDKIKVKTYINEKLGEGHCAAIYGIWENFDDIDFSYIPNKFALKYNAGWKMNCIVGEKSYFMKERALIKQTTKKWLSTKYEEFSVEPQYKYIEPKLFIENLIEQDKDNNYDYQVHCFHEKPLMIETMRKDLEGRYLTKFYDTDWKILPYELKGFPPAKELDRPKFLDEMLEYSKILSKGFSYVRIDFTRTKNGHLYVLEMTFTPHSAMMPFKLISHDFELGRLLEINKKG